MRNTEFLFDASADERRGMIETQIRKRGVSSARVLEAMAAPDGAPPTFPQPATEIEFGRLEGGGEASEDPAQHR